MANSKHAHLRYNILDKSFRTRSLRFIELLDYLNERLSDYYPEERVSERTLREDLKVFRSQENGFDAPLPEKTRILKYDNPNFSIATRPLLEYEQYLVDAAQQLLERFENHPKYEKLAEALLKFQDEEENNDNQKILYYDNNEEYKGIKLLKPFYHAIKKKEVLQIVFKGFNSEKSYTYEFHPQILKQYNRRWFVFGLNTQRPKELWSIPLDERIVKYDILEDIKHIETKVDWDTYFREFIGVIRSHEDKPVRVVLKFHNGRKSFFTSKPFIPDYDEFFEEDKQDQVWFDTIINPELVQQILSFGKDVEVLEPDSLMEKMKLHTTEMCLYYKNITM
jgi:predicted DNA-binding transcriptional regulator YafY